jgi:membrane-associated phospholipid phosphatase
MSVSSGDAATGDPPIASAGVVAWRTRQLVGFTLAAGLVLIGLTLVASEADPNIVDLAATRWLQQFNSPWFAALMAAVSWLGFSPQNLIMPLALAAPFAARRLWVEALWILGSQSSALVTILLKDIVHRARPSPELVGVLAPLTDPSFPSGHVVQYTTLFGVAFFLVYVLSQPSSRRTAALVLLAIPIVLVGPSRLYLGQHWLSDVIGGYAVAAMLLVPYCWAYARWRLDATRRRFKHPWPAKCISEASNDEQGQSRAHGTEHGQANEATRSTSR